MLFSIQSNKFEGCICLIMLMFGLHKWTGCDDWGTSLSRA